MEQYRSCRAAVLWLSYDPILQDPAVLTHLPLLYYVEAVAVEGTKRNGQEKYAPLG
jgi:predicted aconitase with swiveling domain